MIDLDRRERLALIISEYEQLITPLWAEVRTAYEKDPDEMLARLQVMIVTLDLMKKKSGSAALLGLIGAMELMQRMAEWEAGWTL